MKMDDLEEIKVPDSQEYMVGLVITRHFYNCLLELKHLGDQDPEFKKAIENVLSKDGHPDVGDLKEKWAKHLEHMAKTIK